jgi:acyl-CoA reductase-like NAD-dependent aldehyde dehydrogenase
MTDFKLVIDGKSVAGASAFDVINPATGDPFAQCPDASKEQLDQAMASSAEAFLSWRTDVDKRRASLLACADALEKNVDALANVLTAEQGKPLKDAQGEVFGAAVWFKVTAGLPFETEVLQDDDQLLVELHRKPIGVVGAITPWNFPVILAVWKIAPALLAGNTIVLKPSPYTPLSSLKMGEVLQQALPPGVLNVVSGGDQLGRWVSEHDAVRKISFTGSVETGKKIMATAAPDLKRVTLELGGNDPAIVLKDSDPQKVAEKLFWGAFANSGQICVAIKRLYVEEDIYEPVKNAIVDLAKSVKVGDGTDESTQMGPINNLPQFDRVSELVDDARSRGANIEAGGERLGNAGYFYAPTIVTDIDENAPLVAEEQFGPALPVMPFKDVEEVMHKANSTHFGLGGSIWTSDLDRGRELAGRLESGTGWVNQHVNLSPTVPFGGSKWSGIGYENGPWGLAAFTELQVVSTSKE